MRRKEKEIEDKKEIEQVINNALVCRLAMSDDNQPYVVPLCFGYRDGTIFIHSAREGRKIDILKKNNRVCIELDGDTEMVEAKTACKWTVKYRSVIGFGKASLVDDREEKLKAYDVIMGHYAQGPFEYKTECLDQTLIIRVDIETMTGKKS
jgi:nitroimidazol reductase NimA-like FMN-containing flavoprotein (pyridoxamine 5'-phosphate oxidase superfamily)